MLKKLRMSWVLGTLALMLHTTAYAGTWTTIDNPAGATTPNGISGRNIVGIYLDSGGYEYGFAYNGSVYSQ